MKASIPPEIAATRRSEYGIHPLILSRWSQRAMSGESISETELMRLFEAAHWAPSSYNAQPWRFIYAHRDTPEWTSLFSLLVPFNQTWVKKAGVLILIISRKFFEHNQKPSVSHSFDTGAAWGYLALQAHAAGLVARGMEGFNYEKARMICNIPNDYQVECMVAVGKRGKKEDLPEELQKNETPSTRKSLKELVRKGRFTN